MNCNHCTNNLHPTTSYSVCTRANCGCNSFSAGPVVCTPFRDSCEHEPEAPILSLGSRVLWPTEFQHVLGTIRWIGRIPQLSPDWAAGVEFDEPVCNGGNGIFHGRRYFFCPNGHALFLPISDLINNDEVQADSPIPRNECNVSCGCSHTCHNNNSYQYISRPRDATYGHFRHNCYPLCSKDDYQLNGRCCEHIPIYGKISSRRPLCHEDHPYESYITRPVADNVPERKVSDHNYEDAGQNYSLAVDAVHTHSPSCCTEYSTTPRFKGKKTSNRLESSYSDCVMPDIRIPHRESLFIPRGPIKLISGLKEWVSCWVLGTSRRKKRKKYFIQGSKTVTSVVVAANSRSITGERLSALSQYSDVRYKLQDTSNVPSNVGPVSVPGSTSTKSDNSGKKVLRKKRPAPLPPCHVDSGHPTKPEENCTTSNEIKNVASNSSEDATHQRSCSVSCPKQEHKRGKITKQDSRPALPAKTGKAVATKSAHIKRQTKKRPAPLPPVPPHAVLPSSKAGSSTYKTLNLNHRDENGVKIIQQTQVKHLINEANAKSLSDKIRFDSGNRNSMVANILQSKPYSVSKSDANNTNISFSTLIDGIDFFDKSSNSESENNSESRRESISLSGDESEEEPLKWIGNGIISYQNGNECRSSSSVVDHNNSGDVCLKISIQKTETNVMTVERMTPPENVQHNINYHSSLSEASDEENDGISNRVMSVTSIKSSSSDDLQDEENVEVNKSTKPKVKHPQQNSVKSLVQAFNMLAEKSTLGENRNSHIVNQNTLVSEDQSEILPNAIQMQGNLANLKGLKSFPTTWQYQTNGGTNFSHLNNHHLMPIAEESHTEVSEQDAHSSVEEQDGPKSVTKKKPKFKAETGHNPNMLLNTYQDSNMVEKSKECNATGKACSHCSEQHKNELSAELAGQSAVSKRLKKKTGISRPNSGISRSAVKSEMPGNLSPPNAPLVRASEAALSALLSGKSFNAVDLSTEDKGAKSKITPSLHHSKPVARHEQPVMASLYIEDKSSHHGPIPFLVTPSMSVKKLKKKVQKQYKFPKELQCWVLGETFAIQDDSSLASYGVTETGCPILLYVMATESKCRSLPNHPSRRPVKHPIYDDVALTSSDSESDSVSNRSSRKGSLFDSDSDHKTSEIGAQILAARNKSPKPHISHNTNHIPKTSHDKSATAAQKRPPRHPRVKKEKHRIKQEKSGETGGNSKSGLDKNKDYHALVQLDDVDLVTNVEPFECAVCFLDIEAGEGVVLQECLHTFCKECLASAIQFCETALIKCPFRNDEYSCESHLLEREIKSLVTPEVFERHLQRSMALAESQALDSFHCKTPDCPGWCLFEDNVNIFLCPVCKHTNCLTCAAIHEGKNCRQYQDDVAFRCDSSEEAKKTKEYLEDMLKNGDAMKCPKCQVILMKKWGCDWLKCSMCHTEVCWVTKGPRWGPEGRGDTSGGCKCMVNGVRCHPKCNYCH